MWKPKVKDCLYNQMDVMTINVANVSLSKFCTSIDKLYLKNHNGYRDVPSTKMSALPDFIFNINIFMGLKIKES